MSARNVDFLLQLAETAMFQAELVTPIRREALLNEVKDVLIEAEMVSPGSAAWLLACVNARLGNSALVRKWLERARKSETLPEGAKVASSAYMMHLREQNWFQDFVAQID
jgi:hypothetical protein